MRTSTMFRGWVLSFVLYAAGLHGGFGRSPDADGSDADHFRSSDRTDTERLRGRDDAGLVPVRQPDARELDRAGLHRHAQPEDDEPHRHLHGPEHQPDRPADARARPTACRWRCGWRRARRRRRSGSRCMRTLQRRHERAFDTVVEQHQCHRRRLGDADRQLLVRATATSAACILYVESASATASYYIDAFSLAQTAPAAALDRLRGRHDAGLVPVRQPDGRQLDRRGVHRHAQPQDHEPHRQLHGPGRQPAGPADQGRDLSGDAVGAPGRGRARDHAAAPPCQRTPTGGSAQFDSVVDAANVTDQAWVTVTGALLVHHRQLGADLLRRRRTSANASYYIDSFSIAQVAPPPGPPANTSRRRAAPSRAARPRAGPRARAARWSPTRTADAHSGTRSLLTTNRTRPSSGPAFNVTNVMFNGSRYVVSAVGQAGARPGDTQLRVSLQRNAGHDHRPSTPSSATRPSPRTRGCACRRPTTSRWPTRR